MSDYENFETSTDRHQGAVITTSPELLAFGLDRVRDPRISRRTSALCAPIAAIPNSSVAIAPEPSHF
jgi:hypothetical protein